MQRVRVVLEQGELAGQQCSRGAMGAAGEPGFDHFGLDVELHETHIAGACAMRNERIPIGLAQRRAGEHGRLAARQGPRELFAQAGEPWRPVRVGERNSALELAPVRLAVEIVAFDEAPAEPPREHLAHGALSHAGDTDYDYDHAVRLQETAMQLGMVGAGRMGANMVLRLLSAKHQCVVYDVSPAATEALAKEGATAAASIEELV